MVKKKKTVSPDPFEEEETITHLILEHIYDIIQDKDETTNYLLEEQGALLERLSELEVEVSNHSRVINEQSDAIEVLTEIVGTLVEEGKHKVFVQ